MTTKPTACEEARAVLLEGDMPAEHLGGCDPCRSFAASLALVDRALDAGDPRPDPVPHLVDPVLAAIYEGDQRRTKGWMTAAAAVLTTGFAGIAWWSWNALDARVFDDLSKAASGVARTGVQQLLSSGEGFLQAVELPAASLPAMNLMMVSALIAASASSVMLRWMALER